VALYEHTRFQGRQLCFDGPGAIDLANYGWQNTASAINIGAKGTFFDQRGNELKYNHGMRVADLSTLRWNDRIAAFQTVVE
jgi:hypothetical protein